jgi:predicted O-methyltransferase YrrM
MPLSALEPPQLDPTPIFDLCRMSYATDLLTAAATEFKLFERLRDGAKPFDAFRAELGLEARAANVLFTAIRAMNLLVADAEGNLSLSPLAREHLLPGGTFYMGDFLGLSAGNPGVKAVVERLKTNRPASAKPDEGAAYIFREGIDSAMDRENSARNLTLALSGRARNVAPFLADRSDLSASKLLLDIGGGSGIYSIAFLQKCPRLEAVVWDRPEVLKVALEFAGEYGVADRLQCVSGDMFADPMPEGVDVMLLSNILHDWDVPECRKILKRCFESLPAGGRVLIHDVFLNDDLGGPLNLALYSAGLFAITEGRAYSAKEYREWLKEAGFEAGEVVPTFVNCGVLTGTKK